MNEDVTYFVMRIMRMVFKRLNCQDDVVVESIFCCIRCLLIVVTGRSCQSLYVLKWVVQC